MYLDLRLFAMTAGVRGRILLASLVGLAGLPVGLARLALLGVVIAGVIRGRPIIELVPTVLLIALLIVCRAVIQFGKEEVSNRTAAEMKVRLRLRIYEQVLRLGPGPFDQRRTGAVLLSLVDGVEMLETFFGLYLPQLIVASLTPFIIFAFMLFLDVQTAGVFLVFALITLFAPSFFHRLTAASSMTRRDAWAKLGSDFLDGIQGLPTLKMFGRARAHGALLAQRARALYQSTMYVLAVNILTSGFAVLAISAGAAVALGWGAVRVQAGTLELQTLVIVLMLGVEVFRPLRELTALYHRGMVAMSATTAIYQILDSNPDVEEPTQPISPPTIRPEVAFEAVSFAYPSRPAEALHDVSFTLHHGDTLGVVGPSGAGKSTLVWLLQRFYDPQAGRILLDGHDLRALPLDVIRRQIAVVAQDTYLFHGSVADNLRLGKPSATDDELVEAATLANAHEFISALPHGYQTLVGERGARLSGGQRQRIAIARAVLADAPILVLDEALSSVDTENEAAIQQALDRLQRGRTTLVIAHRLSSVVTADRIMVLDEGRVVETGTHAVLMEAGGLYSRLMLAQQKEPELDTTTIDEPAEMMPSLSFAFSSDHHHDHAQHGGGRLAVVSAASSSSFGIWGRLLGLVRPWARDQVIVFLLGLFHAAAVVGLAVVSALLVGVAARNGDVTPWLWALGVMVPVAAILTWAESWLAHDLAYRLLAEMRIDMYEKLDPISPAYLLKRRSGDLVSAMAADIETVEYFFAHTIAPAFVAVLVPTGVLIALGLMAWPLPVVLLPFLVGVGLSPVIARRVAERLGAEARNALGDVNAHMVESVQGLRTLVMFRQGRARLNEIERKSRMFSVVQLGFLRNQAVQSGVIEALTGFGGLAVMTTGAVLVGQGAFNPTLLPLATLLALSSFGPVTDIAKVAKQLAETLGASRRVFAVHDEPVTVLDGQVGAPTAVARRAPAARFEAVSFAYGPGEQPALSGVSFTIEPGTTVALVGRSGAGKTTVANLLCRFWDPQAGRVVLDGHDVRDFRLDDLRRCIAVVSQDTYLFNASLLDNITLGRPEAHLNLVDEATRLSNAYEFIASLPEGLDTTVGERGVQLSGGQRQRVAIARAILKDAPILILDEATSHLDAENERQVRAALDRLMAGRTTLVIAHRLSTIRNADKIVVLDDAQVVEEGTHDELVRRGGAYARLVSAQIRPETAVA